MRGCNKTKQEHYKDSLLRGFNGSDLPATFERVFALLKKFQLK